MAKDLLRRASLIQMPSAKPEPAAPVEAPPSSSKPKTAPGTLAGFMANQSTAIQENEQLRAQLLEFDGAVPTRKLDPAAIGRSKWANRDASAFLGTDWEKFKEEIGSAGGNVQPIMVRRIRVPEGVGRSYPPGVSSTVSYEIVFGHRRHQACLELGLPVLAAVAEVDDRELFVQMERENRNRADLSAWEQGVMYANALDEGLYPSNRQLATSIGRDLSDVGRAISLARLPTAVIEAFARPVDLQFRWAKPLNDAQQADPEKLLTRAQALRGKASSMSAKQIFEALVGAGEEGRQGRAGEPVAIMVQGAVAAKLTSDSKGRATIRFVDSLSAKDFVSLTKIIEEFCKSRAA